jgi:hypothetical protein
VGYSNHGESRDGGFKGIVCPGTEHLVVQGDVLFNKLRAQSITLRLEDCPGN